MPPRGRDLLRLGDKEESSSREVIARFSRTMRVEKRIGIWVWIFHTRMPVPQRDQIGFSLSLQ